MRKSNPDLHGEGEGDAELEARQEVAIRRAQCPASDAENVPGSSRNSGLVRAMLPVAFVGMLPERKANPNRRTPEAYRHLLAPSATAVKVFRRSCKSACFNPFQRATYARVLA